MTTDRSRIPLVGSAALVLLLVISGLRPYDRTTWLLEVFPVLIALLGHAAEMYGRTD